MIWWIEALIGAGVLLGVQIGIKEGNKLFELKGE